MRGFIVFLVAAIVGVHGASLNPRIFGGNEAPYGFLNYMVLLENKGIHAGQCGATLISDEYLLSAAHCFQGTTGATVSFGVKDISNRNEDGRITMEVPKKNIFVHEKYEATGTEHDIAIVKLPRKIAPRWDIKPVRLPARSQTNLEGLPSIIAGWGLNGQVRVNRLRYGQVKGLPNNYCHQFYPKYFYDSAICFEVKDSSPCRGDSGGPAVILGSAAEFIQVGVASFVSPKDCMVGHPVVYTRVTSYLDWIHHKTGITIQE